MIAWMLRTLLAAGAVAGAAALADALVRRAGLPRRPVWATALALTALLPALAALLPATSSGAALSLPPEVLQGLLAQRGAAAAAPARAFPAALLLEGGWALASGALLVMLAYAAWRLRRLCAGWPTVRLEGGEVVLSTGAGPLVVGLRRPRVVVPAWVVSAPAAERQMVLAHEREHVRAGDARLLAAAALVPALAPWNLPAWWLVRRLREAVETDCDRRVLAGGFAPAAYGRLLLSTAAGSRFGLVPGAALVEPKRLLERRLLAMSESVDRRARRLLPLAIGAAALLVLACEVARPDVTAPRSPRGFAVGDTIRFPGGAWAIARAHGCAEDATRSVDRRDSVAMTRALNGAIPCLVEEDLAETRAIGFANTLVRTGATSMTAHLYADTTLMRQRGHPGQGLTDISLRRLASGQIEVATTDARGLTTIREIRVDPRGATDLGPETAEVTGVNERRFESARRMFEYAARARTGAAAPGGATIVAPPRAIGTGTALRATGAEPQPLVFIDGVESTMAALSALPPERIQSIKVLKGAAAQQYGERGANGVLQVTTKK